MILVVEDFISSALFQCSLTLPDRHLIIKRKKRSGYARLILLRTRGRMFMYEVHFITHQYGSSYNSQDLSRDVSSPRFSPHTPSTILAPEVDTIYKRTSCKCSATVFRYCAFLRVRRKQKAEKRLVITRTAQKCVLVV